MVAIMMQFYVALPSHDQQYVLARLDTVGKGALTKAAASEWSGYGRDPQGTHFSPLDQIQPYNIISLQLEWSRDLEIGPWRLEATPLEG